jgi:hypothetical protein
MHAAGIRLFWLWHFSSTHTVILLVYRMMRRRHVQSGRPPGTSGTSAAAPRREYREGAAWARTGGRWRPAFVLWRAEPATGAVYHRMATLNPETGTYVDTDVRSGTMYLYATTGLASAEAGRLAVAATHRAEAAE